MIETAVPRPLQCYFWVGTPALPFLISATNNTWCNRTSYYIETEWCTKTRSNSRGISVAKPVSLNPSARPPIVKILFRSIPAASEWYRRHGSAVSLPRSIRNAVSFPYIKRNGGNSTAVISFRWKANLISTIYPTLASGRHSTDRFFFLALISVSCYTTAAFHVANLYVF
jgi:hypothetical protein